MLMIINSDCNYLNYGMKLSIITRFSSPLIDMNDYGGAGI